MTINSLQCISTWAWKSHLLYIIAPLHQTGMNDVSIIDLMSVINRYKLIFVLQMYQPSQSLLASKWVVDISFHFIHILYSNCIVEMTILCSVVVFSFFFHSQICKANVFWLFYHWNVTNKHCVNNVFNCLIIYKHV